MLRRPVRGEAGAGPVIPLPPGCSEPRVLGEGSFGSVYRVHSLRHGCDVALKLDGGSGRDLAGFELSFELQVAARLHHPNIIQVFDAGRLPDGTGYLLMELATEGALADCVARPMPWTRLLPLLVGLLDGLGHAHARGIVHRDIKAANVLLSRNDAGELIPRIADFGLAKIPGAEGAYASTRMGAGTRLYMPPEQFDNALFAIHPSADLYAFGVLVYLLVAGHGPWEERGLGPLVLEKSAGRFRPLEPAHGTDAPSGLEDLLARLLSASPSVRPQLAADVREELLELGAHRSAPSAREHDSVPQPLMEESGASWMVDSEDSAFYLGQSQRRELPAAPPERALPSLPICTPGLAGVRVPRLVGRQGEKLALWEAARSAARSPVGLAVAGHKGLGSSRLCSWLLTLLEEEGLCRPMHVKAEAPEAVGEGLSAALRRFLGLGRMSGPQLRLRVEQWLAAREHRMEGDAEVLVDWLDRRSEGSPDADPIALRARRLAVLGRLLRTSSARGIACLWLEDRGTGGALAELATSLLRGAQARPFPLLVLYECQGPRAEDRPDGFRSLELGPLPTEALRELVTQFIDSEGGERVLAACGRNTLAAVESARLLAAELEAPGLSAGLGPTVPLERVLSVEDVVDARIRGFLGEEGSQGSRGLLLVLVALLPRPLTGELLHSSWAAAQSGASGSPGSLVESAQRAGLLRRDRWGALDFAEPTLVPAVLRLGGERSDLNGLRVGAARALLASPAGSEPGGWLAAGRLLLEGGEPDSGLEQFFRAGHELSLVDLDAADTTWARALEAVEALGLESDDSRAVAALLGSARTARGRGDLRRTQALLEALRGVQLEGADAAAVSYLRCSVTLARGDLDAVLLLSRDSQQARVRVLRAEAHRRRGELDAARAELVEGLRLAESSGDEHTGLSCRWRLARISRLEGSGDAVLADFAAALEQAARLGEPAAEAIILRELGHLHINAGRLEEAEEVLVRALDCSDRAGSRVETALTRLSLGDVVRLRGDLARARREYSLGLAVAHAYENTGLAIVALLNLALTELALERLRGAERRLAALDRLVPAGTEHAYRSWIEAVRLAVSAAGGHWLEAEDALEWLENQAEALRGQPDFLPLLQRVGHEALEAKQPVVAGDAWHLALRLAELEGDDRAQNDLRRSLATLAVC